MSRRLRVTPTAAQASSSSTIAAAGNTQTMRVNPAARTDVRLTLGAVTPYLSIIAGLDVVTQDGQPVGAPGWTPPFCVHQLLGGRPGHDASAY